MIAIKRQFAEATPEVKIAQLIGVVCLITVAVALVIIAIEVLTGNFYSSILL